MIDSELRELWTPTGLLLGFQLTLFKWRLERESKLGDEGKITWLVLSDYVGILGMLVFVFGVFLLPLMGWSDTRFARLLFGFGVILFVGQTMGLAGHYELYNPCTKRSKALWPPQEIVANVLTAVISGAYLYLASRVP